MTNERDIGRLEAVAENLEKQVTLLQGDIASLKSEISEIKELIATVKGGSSVLVFIGGLVGGGVGAAILKYLPVIFAR